MEHPTTGRLELGMLSDVKRLAEDIGETVLGFPIEWKQEESDRRGKHPDLVIVRRDATKEVIASGEAKRPETPKGATPLVLSEVKDAILKARDPGVKAPIAFTTNFLQFALFDPAALVGDEYLGCLFDGPFEWVNSRYTTVKDWWNVLSPQGRDNITRGGLERFFTKIAAFRAKRTLPRDGTKDETYLFLLRDISDSLVPRLTTIFADECASLKLPEGVFREAENRHFDLTKPDVQRYFVAQAVAEVLTAGLFYQSARGHFSDLHQLLSGTNPASGKVLQHEVERNLRDATLQTGDYETIFNLSRTAVWALSVNVNDIVDRWGNLFDAIAGIRFEEVNSEIIGVIFERLISAERRQDMGQHYTQPRLARAMVQWAVRSDDETVADLSSGGGTFLVEAYNRLRLGGRSHENVLRQVFGNDLDSFAAHLSAVNLATRSIYKGHNFPAVSNQDAFRLRPGSVAVQVAPVNGEPYEQLYPDEFDAIVGNPPYDEKAPEPQLCRKALLDIQLRPHPNSRPPIPDSMPDGVNLAAWFLLLAAVWLAPDGRIDLVLPTAILQNEKHQPLLRWLRHNFNITVWHTETDVWFSDARVAPMVLFAIPRPPQAVGLGRFHFVTVLNDIKGEMIEGEDHLPVPAVNMETRDLSALDPAEDAMIAGTRPPALSEFEAAPNVVPLDALTGCTVESGNKLGHAFFKLKDTHPQDAGVLRDLVGNYIPAKLHRKYLLPLLKSATECATGEFPAGGCKWWILNAPETLPQGGSLEQYVKMGERSGVGRKPSVASRGSKWWHVGWKPSRIAISIHPAFQHQVFWGDDPFVATNNMHILTFTQTVPVENQELTAACLASAFGALSAQYRSSIIGCEGVRWVSTRNLGGWHVLDPQSLDGGQKNNIIAAYREYRRLKTAKLFEMPAATRQAWLRLTGLVAEAAGLQTDSAGAAVATAIETTRRRREREIRATSGRTRSTVAGGTGRGQVLAEVQRNPAYAQVLTVLTGGPRTVRLKHENIRDALFDVNDETRKAIEQNAMAEVLGAGFTAAPTFEDGSARLITS